MKKELELYQFFPDKQGKSIFHPIASMCHWGRPADEGLIWAAVWLASLNREEVQKEHSPLSSSQQHPLLALGSWTCHLTMLGYSLALTFHDILRSPEDQIGSLCKPSPHSYLEMKFLLYHMVDTYLPQMVDFKAPWSFKEGPEVLSHITQSRLPGQPPILRLSLPTCTQILGSKNNLTGRQPVRESITCRHWVHCFLIHSTLLTWNYKILENCSHRLRWHNRLKSSSSVTCIVFSDPHNTLALSSCIWAHVPLAVTSAGQGPGPGTTSWSTK